MAHRALLAALMRALLLGSVGCQTVLEANAGYSAAVTGPDRRHRGALNLRWAIGAVDDTPGSGEPLEHRHLLVDIQVLRLPGRGWFGPRRLPRRRPLRLGRRPGDRLSDPRRGALALRCRLGGERRLRHVQPPR